MVHNGRPIARKPATLTLPDSSSRRYVYVVHTVDSREVRGAESVWALPADAEDRASKRSTDGDVLGVAVTRFTMDALGERHPVALYVDGNRQQVPHVSDDRRVRANGLRRVLDD